MSEFLQKLGTALVDMVVIATCLSSCTKSFDDYSYRDRQDYKVDSLFFREPCYLSDVIPKDVAAVLNKAFPVKGSAGSSEVMIISSDEMAADPAACSVALDEGVILIVFNPDGNLIKEVLASRIPGIKDWDFSGLDFFGVNRYGETCFVAESPDFRYEGIIPLMKWLMEGSLCRMPKRAYWISSLSARLSRSN